MKWWLNHHFQKVKFKLSALRLYMWIDCYKLGTIIDISNKIEVYKYLLSLMNPSNSDVIPAAILQNTALRLALFASATNDTHHR